MDGKGQKWTEMGKFNWYDLIHIYYCGQECLRRNALALRVNRRDQNAILRYNPQNYRIISVCFQGKPFSITVIQVCIPTTNAKEAEVEQLYEDLQDLLELTPEKDVFFHHRGLECRSRKSRNTWSNWQVCPWSTKWNRAKANRVLSREGTGHSKHPLPTPQETTLHMDITRWSTKIRLIMFFVAEDREALHSQQKQEQELTVAQILNT